MFECSWWLWSCAFAGFMCLVLLAVSSVVSAFFVFVVNLIYLYFVHFLRVGLRVFYFGLFSGCCQRNI